MTVMKKENDPFTRLPFDIRRLVMRLLHDGAQLSEIKQHPDVAAALAARNLRLTAGGLQRVRASEEYRHYSECREETARRIDADRWAAAALRECAGISSVADMAQMAVLEQLREIAARGSTDPGELLKITTAVSRIKAADGSRMAEELRNRLAAAEQRAAEFERLLAERDGELEKLRRELTPDVSGTQVADAMNAEFGV